MGWSNKLVACALAAGLLIAVQSLAQQPNTTMSLSEAYRTLRDSLSKIVGLDPAMRFKVTEAGIETSLDGEVRHYRYRDTPDPKLQVCGFFSDCFGEVQIFTKGSGPGASPKCCHWSWATERKDAAERFAAAFKRLAAGAVEDPPEAARFADAAKRFREASPKPPLPEEARRFRVRAESAVSEKRFEDAADGYEEALRAAPWWPEGRFNRALVLAELGRYTEAAREMKKYLALVPDAPNARAAQDKIYEWEDKAGGGR
ncbi:MAG: tetratricopeptide repeat protein [Betaproteobacteria bacterium]